MPKWTPDSATFRSRIKGTNLNNYSATVRVYRERKNEYYVDVDIEPAGERHGFVSSKSVRAADLDRSFPNIKLAFATAMRALLLKLNANGKNTLTNTTEVESSWVYLKDDGTVDWKETYSDKNEAKRDQPLKLTIPKTSAAKATGREHQVGRSFMADVELHGLDESEKNVKIGGPSSQDDKAAKDEALKRFMATETMSPGLTAQETEFKQELTVSGENGPTSGGTLAIDELDMPVAPPGAAFPI